LRSSRVSAKDRQPVAADSGQVSFGTANEVQRAAQSSVRDRPEDTLSSPQISCLRENRSETGSRHKTLHRPIRVDGQRGADKTHNEIYESMGRDLDIGRHFLGN